MALILSGNGTVRTNGVVPIAQGGTGQTTAQSAINALLPDQSSAAGFVLSTDGSNLLWIQGGTGSGLPSQTGQGGKYLTTDGFSAYWAEVGGGGGGGTPAGLSGQLQYNNGGSFAGTSRIFYNDSDILSLGQGTTETFTIKGANASDILRGGTSVVIKGGDFFTVTSGTQVPSAGNVYIVGGGGSSSNTGDPGFISFSVGTNPSETFRIVSGGGWTFNGTSNPASQGISGQFLMSGGSNNTPQWSSLPSGSTLQAGLLRLSPDAPNGLVLDTFTGGGTDLALSAYLTTVDNQTIQRASNGMISIIASSFFPNQDGNSGRYLQTDGTNVSWNAPLPSITGQSGNFLKTDGVSVTWSTFDQIATASQLGVVKVDGTTIRATVDGMISANAGSILPSQSGNINRFLKTDGEILSWSDGSYVLPIAGTEGAIGGVIPDNSTIKINPYGVISVDSAEVLPDQDGNSGKYLSTNGLAAQWVTSSYVLPVSTPTLLGGVKIDNQTIVMNSSEVISASINALLPSQTNNANKFLTTNGSTVSWSTTPYILPIASQVTLGGIYTDGVTTVASGSGVLTVPAIQVGPTGTGRLLYNATGLSAETNRIIYSGDTTLNVGTLSASDAQYALPPAAFTIAGTRSLNIYGGAPTFLAHGGGSINIAAGSSLIDSGAAGTVSIQAGAGASGAGSNIAGGNVVISAGTGAASGGPGYLAARGGDLILGSDGGSLNIRYSGDWILSSNTIYSGSPGQPLVSNGEGSSPYWGSIPVAYGGTGASTPASAAANILPTQSGNNGKVLGTTGSLLEWVLPPQLPDQTDKNGYILSTNGSIPSWIVPFVPAPGPINYVLMSTGSNYTWTPIVPPNGPLPIANTTSVGGIVVGSGLTINTSTGVLDVGNNGILSISNGGTGANTAQLALNALAGATTANRVLRGDGINIALGFVDLNNDSSNTPLGIIKGGTGATTASGAIANLLPSQSGNENKVLSTDGINTSWRTPSSIAGGSDGNIQYNSGGSAAGAARINLTGVNELTLGTPSNGVPADGTFYILGASSNISNTVASSILIRPGTQIRTGQTGSNLFLSGGLAQVSGATGGDVIIDGGLSTANTGGSSGSVIIRTSNGPASPLTNRLVIGGGGAWAVNGDYGLTDEVLTSTGPDDPPLWRRLNADAFSLTGSELAPGVTSSNLANVGILTSLTVSGNVGIGTSTPQSPLVISLGNSSTGIEITPNNSLSTIKAITRSDDWHKPLAIDGMTVSIRTGPNTSVTNRLTIDSDGSWNISNSSGSLGQSLISSGAGASPYWGTVDAVRSINVSGGSTGLTTSGGPVTSTGTITLAGTVNVSSGGTGATSKIDASQNVSNFGQLVPFSQYTDFNSVQRWGSTYIAGSSNAPSVPSALGQFYQFTLAIGDDYDWNSGNVYASQMAFPRDETSPYISIRYKSGGTNAENWGSWQRISAGYADAADTANTADFATLSQNVTGVVAIENGGTGSTTANASLNSLLPNQSGNANKFLMSSGANTSWQNIAPQYQYITATADQLIVNTTVNTNPNLAGTSYLQVFINGVLQMEGPSKSYTVTGSNQITFNSALSVDDDIVLYSFG